MSRPQDVDMVQQVAFYMCSTGDQLLEPLPCQVVTHIILAVHGAVVQVTKDHSGFLCVHQVLQMVGNIRELGSLGPVDVDHVHVTCTQLGYLQVRLVDVAVVLECAGF